MFIIQFLFRVPILQNFDDLFDDFTNTLVIQGLLKHFRLVFFILLWKYLIVKAPKILQNSLYALFGEFSLSTCLQSTIGRRFLKCAIDLLNISRLVICMGSFLESSIKAFEIRNLGKWSKISAVKIPECISLLRKSLC